MTRLIDDGFAIEFETNGTVSPEGLPRGVHLNVSPKLENSMQPVEQRIKLQVLKECLAWPSSVLKFVVGEQCDLDEVCGIVEQLDIPSHRVFLMPLGTVCICHSALSMQSQSSFLLMVAFLCRYVAFVPRTPRKFEKMVVG